MPLMIWAAAKFAAAEPVQRRAARLHVIARVQRRHPSQVAALLAALGGGGPDDVVHLRCVQIVALLQGLEHRGGEMLGVHVRQCALPLLADPAGCAHRIDDISVRQGPSPMVRANGTFTAADFPA
jgi:hypothetical protein